jgi:ribose/xylose/arabinose/galactoside ABC-type transport system permease subunit
MLIWFAILFVVWVALVFTTIGRRLSVSRAMERIPTLRKTSDRVTGFALITGCVLVSFSSLFLFAKMNGAPISFSRNYTFDILAGVFLGGIGGSRPSTLIPRALVGSLTIVLLNAVLLFTGLSAPMETLLKGSVILFGCYFADYARKS